MLNTKLYYISGVKKQKMKAAHASTTHAGEGGGRRCPHLVLLLVLQDGLQEGAPLVARGLLVEHAGLDHLLVHVELVLGRRQDLLLHAIDRAEAEHAHLVLLPDAVGAVLRLQVLPEETWVCPWPALQSFMGKLTW